MRDARLWGALLGVEKAVVEGVELVDENGGLVIAQVRPARAVRDLPAALLWLRHG